MRYGYSMTYEVHTEESLQTGGDSAECGWLDEDFTRFPIRTWNGLGTYEPRDPRLPSPIWLDDENPVKAMEHVLDSHDADEPSSEPWSEGTSYMTSAAARYGETAFNVSFHLEGDWTPLQEYEVYVLHFEKRRLDPLELLACT